MKKQPNLLQALTWTTREFIKAKLLRGNITIEESQDFEPEYSPDHGVDSPPAKWVPVGKPKRTLLIEY